jgi:hypothetical protein
MSKENKNKTLWSIEIGFYPGVLLGARTYYEDHQTTHVLYIPFVDIAITLYKE